MASLKIPVGQPSGWRLLEWRIGAILKDAQQTGGSGWLGASMTAFCEMTKTSASRLLWLWVVISSINFSSHSYTSFFLFVFKFFASWWPSRAISMQSKIHKKGKEISTTEVNNLPVKWQSIFSFCWYPFHSLKFLYNLASWPPWAMDVNDKSE